MHHVASGKFHCILVREWEVKRQMIAEYYYEHNFYFSSPGIPGLHFENYLLVWGQEYGHCSQTEYGGYLGQVCGGTWGTWGLSPPEAHVAVRVKVAHLPPEQAPGVGLPGPSADWILALGGLASRTSKSLYNEAFPSCCQWRRVGWESPTVPSPQPHTLRCWHSPKAHPQFSLINSLIN